MTYDVIIVGSGEYGISLYQSVVTISNCYIEGNGQYGISFYDSEVTISGCTITGYEYPFRFNGGSLTLQDNNVSGNANHSFAVAGNITPIPGTFFKMC